MSKPDFEAYFADFDNKFPLTLKEINAATEIGIGQAMLQLLNDCVMIPPTVPHKEGTLRGSGSVFVGQRLVATTEHFANGKGKPNPAKTHQVELSQGKLTGIAGFNTPYAARLHEHPEYKFKEPGSGGHYMSSKIVQFREMYLQMVAGYIKKKAAQKHA